MNINVNSYFEEATQWRDEMRALRRIILACGLTEEMKWGKPCYSWEAGNVVIIQGFKAYCALLFFKGSLVPDPDKILVKTGPNTQVGRQIRFTDAKQIAKMESMVKTCLRAAIEVEKSGLKVTTTSSHVSIPEELKSSWKKDAKFEAAFHALTPGRQRAYLYFFSGAKQSATREARIAKSIPQILKGKGLLD